MINKKIILSIFALTAFIGTMNPILAKPSCEKSSKKSPKELSKNELSLNAKHFTKILVGTGLILGGTCYLGNHFHVLNKWAYKPLAKKILEITQDHPWVKDIAKYTVPPLAIYTGWKVLQSKETESKKTESKIKKRKIQEN